MLHTIRLVSFSLLTIALSVACGASTPAAAPATAAPTTAAKAAATSTVAAAGTPAPLALNVGALEQSSEKYLFEPSTISVKVGQAVTVHYSNPSTSMWPHTFVIKSADGKELVKSEQVRPGNALDINFTLPEAGTFQLLCIQRGHADKGQVGTVTATKS